MSTTEGSVARVSNDYFLIFQTCGSSGESCCVVSTTEGSLARVSNNYFLMFLTCDSSGESCCAVSTTIGSVARVSNSYFLMFHTCGNSGESCCAVSLLQIPITISLYFRPVAVVVRVAVLCPLQKDQWPGFPTAISTGRVLFQTINNKWNGAQFFVLLFRK